MWIFRPSVLFCVLITYMGVDGIYKSPYFVNRPHHPRTSGCTDLQCLEQQQIVNIPGLQDPMTMQDLKLYQESQSQPMPQFPQNADIFRELEDSAERTARTRQILGEVTSVGAQDNSVGKRNHLNDRDDKYSSIGGSAYNRDYSNDPGQQMTRSADFLSVTSPICTCNHSPNVMDLGPNRFPRILNTLDCAPGSCWVQPFSCKRKLHVVWVLKQKESDDKVDKHAPLLPESLRSAFMFQAVTVTVACECGV